MGLLDNGIAGVARELGVPESTAKENTVSYRKPISPDDFDSFGSDLQSKGEEVEIARYQIPAGIARRWGYGRADVGAGTNQGFLFGKLQNASGEEIDGQVSFKWENATGREVEVTDEAQTQDMSTSNRYDREQQRPFPERTDKKRAVQDQYLVVTFTPSTAASDITNNYGVDKGKSEARWPTTEYDLS